ncbi:MAG: hypothetical protein F6K22_31955 [Okeania sp. SIO2F4]|nr:hypothetical protein [Okeania sp. SIO2F4]
MIRKQQLYYEINSGNINSEIVIKFLDKLLLHLSKKTVVIMDQASLHTSDAMSEKLEEWKHKNLEIFWLPTYSPKLKLIEIIGKFIKYEWIEINVYESWKILMNYLKKVPDNLGDKYVINFV